MAYKDNRPAGGTWFDYLGAWVDENGDVMPSSTGEQWRNPRPAQEAASYGMPASLSEIGDPGLQQWLQSGAVGQYALGNGKNVTNNSGEVRLWNGDPYSDGAGYGAYTPGGDYNYGQKFNKVNQGAEIAQWLATVAAVAGAGYGVGALGAAGTGAGTAGLGLTSAGGEAATMGAGSGAFGGATASTAGGMGGAAAGTGYGAGAAGLGGAGGVGGYGASVADTVGAAADGAGGGVAPYETVSEGFGPEFEQAVANGTWEIPSYPPGYGVPPTSGMPPVPPVAPPGGNGSGVPPPGGTGPGVSPPNPYTGIPGALNSIADGNFNWGSLLSPGVIGPVLSAAGGIAGANAAEKAADAQVQSARESNALLKAIYDDQKALNEPFRQNGLAAGNKMLSVLGLGGDPNAPGYGSATKPYVYTEDPGYQFRLSEGEKAQQRRLSAGGALYSGKALKDATRFAEGLATEDYTNGFNRDQTTKTNDFNKYASLYGSGQTAANTLTGAAGNYGSQASGNVTGAGNATAAGIVGRSNAYNNALSQGTSMYQQNELMRRLLPAGSY